MTAMEDTQKRGDVRSAGKDDEKPGKRPKFILPRSGLLEPLTGSDPFNSLILQRRLAPFAKSDLVKTANRT